MTATPPTNGVRQRTVLFLCSGNYYRSRFAEMLFNHVSSQAESGWRAESRGLAYPFTDHNVGPMSAHALRGLRQIKVPVVTPVRFPQPVQEADFKTAQHIVAVKENEHRSMLERTFQSWLDRVEFWHIHDLDAATPDQALPELEQAVRALHERLTAK